MLLIVHLLRVSGMKLPAQIPVADVLLLSHSCGMLRRLSFLVHVQMPGRSLLRVSEKLIFRGRIPHNHLRI